MTPGPATGGRRSGTSTAASPPPPTGAPRWPDRRRNDPAPDRQQPRTRSRGHRAEVVAAGRGGRASTRTAGGGQRRAAPSRTGRHLPARPDSRRPARRRTPEGQTCRFPPRRAPRAHGSHLSGLLRPAGRAPRIRPLGPSRWCFQDPSWVCLSRFQSTDAFAPADVRRVPARQRCLRDGPWVARPSPDTERVRIRQTLVATPGGDATKIAPDHVGSLALYPSLWPRGRTR